MKIFFGLMGFALTIISVTGINLWLAKRAKQDALNQLWLGFCVGHAYRIYLGCIVRANADAPHKTCFLGNIDSYSYRFTNAKSAYENALGAVELSRRLVSCIGHYSLCCSLPLVR